MLNHNCGINHSDLTGRSYAARGHVKLIVGIVEQWWLQHMYVALNAKSETEETLGRDRELPIVHTIAVIVPRAIVCQVL